MTPTALGSEFVGSELVGSELVGSEFVGSESIDSDPRDLQRRLIGSDPGSDPNLTDVQ